MGALVQIKAQSFASFRAIVSPPRPPLIPAPSVPVHEPRAFPCASTRPTLPSAIRDEMLELYAFIFCQGGFRQLDMTFEQFLLVAAAIEPADLPATRKRRHSQHPRSLRGRCRHITRSFEHSLRESRISRTGWRRELNSNCRATSCTVSKPCKSVKKF
jgi:hypothetical protein